MDVYEHLVQDDFSGLIKMFASVGKDAIESNAYANCNEHQTRRMGEEKVDEFFRFSPKKSSTGSKDQSNRSNSRSEIIKSLKNIIFHSDRNDQSSISCKERSSDLSSGANKEVENVLLKVSSDVANQPPNASFIVENRDTIDKRRKHQKMQIESTSDNTPPLFDGSIALATPRSTLGGSGLGTALHLACALDSPFGLAILLIMGGDAKSKHTGFQRSLFHEAASADSPDCLRLLLELGTQYDKNFQGPTVHHSSFFDWSIPQPDDRTPNLSFSATLKLMLNMAEQIEIGKLDDLEAARNLLSNIHLSKNNKSAIASLSSKFPETEHHRSNPIYQRILTSVDGHGNTPLHWASFKNSTSCVSILLEHHHNSSFKASPSGWTPLHDAAYSNAAESVELLVKAGADIDARANSGATPLCFAAQENAPEAAKLLLEAEADPQVRCCGQNSYGSSVITTHSRFSGYTPLHYCAHYNAHDAARVLLEYTNQHNQTESLLEIQDLNEKLPIHIAVARGSSDVLRELLHFGARVDITNNNVEIAKNQTTGHNNSLAVSPPGSNININNTDPSSPIVVTPVSSPVLRSMIPNRPVRSSKPWNCLSQRSIDECRLLINEVESNWSPRRHTLFHPADRRAVLELLRVGKRLEQIGSGIFLDLWPEVLSFCGRGWFISNDSNKCNNNSHPTGSVGSGDSKYPNIEHTCDTEMAFLEDDVEFTQFQLDD